MNIIKRDGRKVRFDRSKIETAVQKAFLEVDGDIGDYARSKSSNIADYIEKESEKEELGIEDIQDLVVKGLMSSKRKDVAVAYIVYRHNRTIERERNSILNKMMTEKLMATNVNNSNANMDEHSFGGRKGEATSVFLKNYALEYVMSKKASDNHKKNRIYTHDLDSYALGMHNCLTVPLDDLLANGFNTRQTDIRPANSINSAFQLLAVIFQIQSLQQFGGVSSGHTDHTMAPYVKKSFYKHYIKAYLKTLDSLDDILSNPLVDIDKLENWADKEKAKFHKETGLTKEDICINNRDKLNRAWFNAALYDTKKELYQAVEGLYHNLNSLQSRSGNQLPFSSINYGTDTSTEGRMVTKALLEGLYKGVGKLHRTSVFPCGIFQLGKGINRKPGDPNYDLFKLSIKNTSKRLYPNYANIDWSGNAGYDKNDPRTYFSTMGKRKLSSCKTF